MSIVSPLHTKLTIKMPARLDNTGHQPIKNLTEYTLFVLLEKQRNKKLREIYRGVTMKTSKNKELSKENITLPKLPPRYQCLEPSAEWIVSEVTKQRRELLVHNSTREQWKAGLDQVTKTYLEDLVNVLKQQYGECRESPLTTSSVLPCMPSLSPSSPTAITPPSSPVTVPQAESEYYLLTRDHCSRACRKEVDISDNEIMSIWDCTAPSEDGIEFDLCE